MRLKHVVLSGLLLLGAQGAWSETYVIDSVHSQVGFKIRHLVSKVKGNFTVFSGTVTFNEKSPADLKAEAVIQTTSVNTGNDKRDEHLRSPDFFNSAKFPTMTFKSTKATVAADGKISLAGDLTLLGVTKPVILAVELGGVSPDPWGNTRAGFAANGKISRKDFGMTYNIPMDKGSMVLGDEVEISIDVESVNKK